VIPGSKSRTVLSANDLNPRRVSDLRNTRLAGNLSIRRSSDLGHDAPVPRQSRGPRTLGNGDRSGDGAV
jgi:hypothetical protein